MALPSDRPDERYHSDGCDLHVFGDDDGGGEKSDPRRRADTVPGRDKRSEVDRPALIAVVSQLTDWVIADGDILSWRCHQSVAHAALLFCGKGVCVHYRRV
uniref:Uncharacterized protein n=1 Tax=Plectus sambesii TaxID=2011161 RepID=A0A914WWT1_9BILA